MTHQPGLMVREATICGEVYRLNFSTFAFEALQEKWGLTTLDETLNALATMHTGGVTLKGLNELVWAALRRYHPEKSFDDVRVMLNDNGIGETRALVEQVSLVIAASMPVKEGGGKPHPMTAPKRRAS